MRKNPLFPACVMIVVSVCAVVASMRASVIAQTWWMDRSGAACIELIETGEKPLVGMFSTHPTLEGCMFLYSDRNYKAHKHFPERLRNAYFYELSIKQPHVFRCTRDGDIFALASVNQKKDSTGELRRQGFSRTADKPFQLHGENPLDVVAVFSRRLHAGETFTLPAGAMAAGFDVGRPALRGGDLLHNGIRLPAEWPPRIYWDTDIPRDVPYLARRPEIVPIDVGRQLFVDDFLIESSDLEREFHYPEKYRGNPVLKPETALEKEGANNLAVAGPKSGGLWWNADKQLFELWYEAGWVTTIAYATSRDGIHWQRPDLPLKPGTNQVLPSEIKPDSWTIVRDYHTADPKKNHKIFLRGGGSRNRARYFVSEDGIDWGAVRAGGYTGDRSTMFYNPFRKKWVYSLRWNSPGGRSRAYWEADDFEAGMNWLPSEPVPWARADNLDFPDPRAGDKPQLYNLDAVAYESIMLGFFEILHGPPNNVNAKLGQPKHTGLNFAYSRDGFHWHRPDRKMAINSEWRDTWDRGYVQSLGNICVVRGDKLWFYYIGFAGDTSKRMGEDGITSSMKSGLYGNGATGVATLRRDGFVSLNAGARAGVVLTRPLIFSGKYLFANVDAPRGALHAEITDMDGKAIAPFTFENCIPICGDTTLEQIKWRGVDSLEALAGRAVRIRFKAENAKFYSFWVSRDSSGRSDGYVAGGGPGYVCDIDTAGKAALEAEAKLMSPYAQNHAASAHASSKR